MKKNTQNKICSRCVMDETATEITFDESGVCNFCNHYDQVLINEIFSDKGGEEKLEKLIKEIKEKGKNSKYDCLIGLSGGVDSTYLAYLAIKLGLRPMAVHFDNGWNTEQAVKNIENIVSKLKLDLNTYVIDWHEFKEVQLAYLKASVVDIEVPTDQLVFAALNKIAKQNNIKYILSGYNIVTEYGLPTDWVFKNKADQTNLLNIYKQFGKGKKLTTIPKFDFYTRFFYTKIIGIQTIGLLNYINYNKEEIKKLITSELGWQDFGGKHYESIFTRFYQGYILPKKFNIDKRKAHLSALICSGQIAKEQALAELKDQPYDVKLQEEDKQFVIKKFDLTSEEFENIMKAPRVEHEFYGTEDDNKKMHKLFANLFSFPVYLINFYRRVKNKFK